MTNTATAVQMLATQARIAFEQAERADGSLYWRIREGTTEWIHSVVRATHRASPWLNDDDRYTILVAALDTLITTEDPDAARDSFNGGVWELKAERLAVFNAVLRFIDGTGVFR